MKFIFIIIFVFTSCGYHIESRRKVLPDGSKTLYIEPFSNLTTTSLVENYFTDEMKRQFFINRDIKLVSKSNANVIMRGSVDSINLTATAFKKNNDNLEAKEYLITMTVTIRLMDKKKVFWKKTFSEQEVFNVFDNIMKNESERVKAASRVSKNMMRKVYDTMFSSFIDES